jgi:hypothetical protein
MRIAFYSPQPSHLKLELAKGGDPIFLRDLLAEFRRRGHEIEVISRLNIRHLWKGNVPARSVLAEARAVRRRVKVYGRTGVLAGDLVEFRTQLGELVADRVRREAMGQAAREYVATNHSMEVRARQVEELLTCP